MPHSAPARFLLGLIFHLFIEQIAGLEQNSASKYALLQQFYDSFENYTQSSEANPAALCKLKWERTLENFGRRTSRGEAKLLCWAVVYLIVSNYFVEVDISYGLSGNGTNETLLIHVGKTGGGSLRTLLINNGINFEQVHFHAVDAGMIRSHKNIIIAVRDPAERLVSAFNWHNPRCRPIKPIWQNLGFGDFDNFYGCFGNPNEFASAVIEDNKCGQIARLGNGHVEFDTCAYVGGLVEELHKHRRKVFVVDTADLLQDVNHVSKRLRWGLTFTELPRIHTLRKSVYNISRANLRSKVILKGYVEYTGEAQLYRKLVNLFKPHHWTSNINKDVKSRTVELCNQESIMPFKPCMTLDFIGLLSTSGDSRYPTYTICDL